MINFEQIKKLVATDASLKITESADGALIIMKEDVVNNQDDIVNILSTFGVSAEDIMVTSEGTEIHVSKMTANKFQLLLSPFADMSTLIVKDPYTLLISGLFLQLDESDVQENSIDDVPSAEGVAGVQKGDDILTVEELATFLDENISCDINIISDAIVETNIDEKLINFLGENEANLEAFSITLTNDKISYLIK